VLNSTRKRPRTFGLSHESTVSTLSSSSRSKGLPLSSPIVHDKDNDDLNEKETSDKDTPSVTIQCSRGMGTKPADQLTLFGATFGGLGKKRKPHPRFV
jgi:hypothetical protein